ncbi:hypothetical protein RJ639_039348 [Escallonia herrerae]|uniref:Reverse transcriptase RNase H-like domain-containing protein n=1 Tax=Escallonia herrerae TaxID=1293975 RepID=A0AA88WVD8_9ASTE|nr:hypothetical protein RJ639_039348 [Escallonia herrerae]
MAIAATRTTTIATSTVSTVVPATTISVPITARATVETVTAPRVTTVITPLISTVQPPLQPTGMTNIDPPIIGNQVNLMAVIHSMQQSIERLQAVIENPPPRSEPPRALGTSKTPEQTSHNQHVTQTEDEEFDGERRHPRSRRHEENYSEAHYAKNIYANTGGNRAEHYSNAPIIIGRPFTEEIDLFSTPPHFKMPPYPGMTFAVMASGVRPGTPLQFSLNKRPLENMSDLLDRVEKYLQAEEDSMPSRQEENHSGQKRRDHPEGKNQDGPKRPQAILPKLFTPLNTTHEHILHQIKGQDILKWPKPMRRPAERKDTQLYCHFHKDHGHTTEECKVLQREIENLIAKGSLRKAYARQVNLTQGPLKRARAPTSLEFNDLDLEGVRSSDDILFEDAFLQMGISEDRVKPITSPLYSFTGIFGITPLLSKPVLGEELFLYLAVAKSAVSAVLVQEEAARQLPIYYVSKVLQGAEQRYPDNEKLAFALLMVARKLRPYFQSHTIVVLTDKPLRRILHKPDLSGHLVPWSVELGEFDIQSRPRPSIKRQALADFIVECTLPIEDEAVLPTPRTPTNQGQTEVTNRTLLQGIRKKLDDVKGLWVDELPKILWAYNTTTRTLTSETPFSLSFGMEALIPVEIGLPSLRLTTYDPVQNAKALHANLDLFDERREQAAMRLATYQHRVSKFYDQRVRPRMF